MKKATLTAALVLFCIATTALAQREKLLEIPDVSRDKVICFALYTVHNDIMKMTAQLYPLKEGEERKVRVYSVDECDRMLRASLDVRNRWVVQWGPAHRGRSVHGAASGRAAQ